MLLEKIPFIIFFVTKLVQIEKNISARVGAGPIILYFIISYPIYNISPYIWLLGLVVFFFTGDGGAIAKNSTLGKVAYDLG